jgi:subfamily B ATP-binding cassette protein MsbA
LRFIEPERGRILVDGVPLNDIAPESWNRRIAFVEQNAYLFNASVRENIGYGDLEADVEAIRQAARIAQAEDFIEELEKGYDTMIGESGVRLSQGQRQRIAFARSLLRKPDVLILDEATNALDRPTERALRAAIEQAHDERAIIVIAHRRETIEAADQVVILDDGRVVAAGRPDDLARAEPLYAELYLDDAVADRA